MENKDFSNILVVNPFNEILLQKKDLRYKWAPGKWCLFGGEVEKNEAHVNTALREFLEETTYSLKNLYFLRQKTYKDIVNGDARQGTQFTYFSIFEGNISDLRMHEGCGFAFFSKEELSTLPIKDYDVGIIRDYHAISKDKDINTLIKTLRRLL